MKKDKKNISLAVLLFPVCSILIMLASCVSSSSVKKDEGVFVKKIEGLSKDFVMGADISSILSLEQSGVVFKNTQGTPADIFTILKDHGI